jgi:hypothetical protein
MTVRLITLVTRPRPISGQRGESVVLMVFRAGAALRFIVKMARHVVVGRHIETRQGMRACAQEQDQHRF